MTYSLPPEARESGAHLRPAISAVCPRGAASKLVIIPTIDVEGAHGSDPFGQMVLGEIGQPAAWGTPLIARLLAEYAVEGTFFLDVYEHSLHGEERWRRLAESLQASGQDVQLHTHPGWQDDPADPLATRRLLASRSCFGAAKPWMASNSLARQIEILEHGIDCLRRWTGHAPIAHRAGGYAANADTMRALRHVGIPVDASMNIGESKCDVQWSINAVVERDGLIEVPVTGFWHKVRWRLGSVVLPRTTFFHKTDIDSCTLEQLRWYVSAAKRMRLRVMVLFLHSYSLIRCDARYDRFWPDTEDRTKLERFLSAVLLDTEVEVKSLRQFLEAYRIDPTSFTTDDVVPTWVHDRPVQSMLRDLVRTGRPPSI